MKCIKVLLIEDNLGDAVLIQEMLKDVKTTNFQVKHAQILSEGIIYLQNEDFDIILLDLALPDSQGIDTFNRTNEHATLIPESFKIRVASTVSCTRCPRRTR